MFLLRNEPSLSPKVESCLLTGAESRRIVLEMIIKPSFAKTSEPRPEGPECTLIHELLQHLASLISASVPSGTKLCALTLEAAGITASFPPVVLLDFSE